MQKLCLFLLVGLFPCTDINSAYGRVPTIQQVLNKCMLDEWNPGQKCLEIWHIFNGCVLCFDHVGFRRDNNMVHIHVWGTTGNVPVLFSSFLGACQSASWCNQGWRPECNIPWPPKEGWPHASIMLYHVPLLASSSPRARTNFNAPSCARCLVQCHPGLNRHPTVLVECMANNPVHKSPTKRLPLCRNWGDKSVD